MKKIALFSLFNLICACAIAQAQIVNYVKNPDFERYDTCPIDWGQLVYAKYWNAIVDTTGANEHTPEYYNACANILVPDLAAHIPDNAGFYQNCHSGNGMVGGSFYYDKTPPALLTTVTNYRDYIQGHLVKPLSAGKTYCVTYWVNNMEAGGYAHNKMGAYFDNGAINTLVDTPGQEVTFLTPQIFTNDVIIDTAKWTKIEGSFVATGNETHITIGNFSPNTAVTTVVTNYWLAFKQYSAYLIDDVSVIPIDLDVQAGADTWVEQGSKRKIGRIEDSATVLGLDCKWYKKGILIDSGAIISVNANAVKYAIDTYVVVQTICGVVKSDTVLVKTVGLGVHEFGIENAFSIFPNPSNGTLNISASFEPIQVITAKVYDLLGRVVYHSEIQFANNITSLNINLSNGTYIFELQNIDGYSQKERIVIQ